MTAENVERVGGPPEEPTTLAARCADWLMAERDRIEREVRAEYERSTADAAGPPEPPEPPKPPQPPKPDAAVPAPAPAVAAPLIRLLDRVAELPSSAAAAGSAGSAEGHPRDPVLDWVRRSVLAALTASGVTPVEDSGPVDPTRHNVVATRADPSGLRCGAIAETVRPGYLWGEAVLRHQEVVAFVPPGKPGPGETATAHGIDETGAAHRIDETGDAPGIGETRDAHRFGATHDAHGIGEIRDAPEPGKALDAPGIAALLDPSGSGGTRSAPHPGDDTPHAPRPGGEIRDAPGPGEEGGPSHDSSLDSPHDASHEDLR
ncbi:hypothetical protein ACFU53_02720 [Streptomyces sp. NPDC057474]|uniref:hypothetical protein n=1 Tax=Streptomyces sp. NPDC057474 TaxID=3346144 RepID=UPI0036CC2576